MSNRLICDTCSAIKLVYFGDQLFKPNAIGSGSLVIHPRIFLEVKRWHPIKKKKYKKEIDQLNKISSTPGLGVTGNLRDTQYLVIAATRDQLGLSVGRTDIEQLISVLVHDCGLITNDGPFSELADALDIGFFEAEEILLEAIEQSTLSIDDASRAIKHWEANGEKRPQRTVIRLLKTVGINYP